MEHEAPVNDRRLASHSIRPAESQYPLGHIINTRVTFQRGVASTGGLSRFASLHLAVMLDHRSAATISMGAVVWNLVGSYS